MRKVNITGNRFGKLVALRENGYSQSPSRKHTQWECLCDCGKLINVPTQSLRSGKQKSCGCSRDENPGRRTHSMSKTVEHNTWLKIKDRCFNKKNKNYDLYGGRGITMCKEWRDSFEKFYQDMGKRPPNMNSIDRVDPNADYCKENCRWSDVHTQTRNKRNNVYFEFDGKKMCQADWAKFLGITHSTLRERLAKWPLERALSTLKEK